MRRKCEETMPVVGTMATSLESGARSIWKRATRKRSTQRHYYAQVLTVHPVSCTCDLAQNIITNYGA
ncbi:MAG: hypothetical protein ACJASG_000275 [Oleiphilaceae bacterium]|jgi:hypothetical protein